MDLRGVGTTGHSSRFGGLGPRTGLADSRFTIDGCRNKSYSMLYVVSLVLQSFSVLSQEALTAIQYIRKLHIVFQMYARARQMGLKLLNGREGCVDILLKKSSTHEVCKLSGVCE